MAQNTLVLKPGPAQGKDCVVGFLVPDNNYANAEHLPGYAWTQGGQLNVTRSLLAFDLAAIPEGASIVHAELSCFFNPTYIGYTHSGDNGLLIERITQPWQEDQATWNNQPAVSGAHVLSIPPSLSETQDYLDMNVTQLVQDMVNDPANSFGFRFRLVTEEPYKFVLLASSDYPDSLRWPELHVTYSLPDATEERSKATNALGCWPNPATDVVLFRHRGLASEAGTVQLCDAMGRVIARRPLRNGQVEVGDLAPGCYLAMVTTPNGRSLGETRLVIMR